MEDVSLVNPGSTCTKQGTNLLHHALAMLYMFIMIICIDQDEAEVDLSRMWAIAILANEVNK